jgi:hypothetical protein
MPKRDPGTRATLTLRLREDLRKKLEAEARNKEYSLNTEIVRRLENSLLDENIGSIVFHDKDVFTLANLFATLIRAYQIKYKKTWSEDPEICRAASDTLCALLNKAPELFRTGEWPGGLRTLADQGALGMINLLTEIDERVREDNA